MYSCGMSKLWGIIHSFNIGFTCPQCSSATAPTAVRDRSNHLALLSANHLAQQCPGNHVHKPYQVTKQANTWKFDTPAEREYPWLLCMRICQALQSHFKPNFTFACVQNQHLVTYKPKRHRALIPEYLTIVTTSPSDDNYKVLPPFFQGGSTGKENHL